MSGRLRHRGTVTITLDVALIGLSGYFDSSPMLPASREVFLRSLRSESGKSTET
jgi:hypothetical protein